MISTSSRRERNYDRCHPTDYYRRYAAATVHSDRQRFPSWLGTRQSRNDLGTAILEPDHLLPFYDRLFGVTTNYTFLAVPLFIFIGIMVEKSGISKQLFNTLYLWLGGLRGGLAVATIWFGTISAATVGVIAASVTMLGLIAPSSMLHRGYSSELTTGACYAGGSLGILIPPTIMLNFYGPMANISVGRLFMATFPAGLTLSALYTIYVLVRCGLQPTEAPVLPAAERNVGLGLKLRLLFTALLPPVFLVLAMRGSIFSASQIQRRLPP